MSGPLPEVSEPLNISGGARWQLNISCAECELLSISGGARGLLNNSGVQHALLKPFAWRLSKSARVAIGDWGSGVGDGAIHHNPSCTHVGPRLAFPPPTPTEWLEEVNEIFDKEIN